MIFFFIQMLSCRTRPRMCIKVAMKSKWKIQIFFFFIIIKCTHSKKCRVKHN